MRLGVCVSLVALAVAGSVTSVAQQQPAGVNELLSNMTSEHVTRTEFTLDHDMLQSATGFLNDGSGPPMQLNSLTVENYKYKESAFYIPETMHALVKDYSAAGWMHLVDEHAGPKDSAMPEKPLTDLWLHYVGTTIDGVTVLVRGRRFMSVVEVSGEIRPMDLVHLSGHFGIPRVDPGAVMVPAAPGR
jgi:hypothetical protein